MSNAFITGSRAYGTPREDSDVDLVVLVESEDGAMLWEQGVSQEGEKTCRFGKLNLLVFESRERFNKWRDVTEELQRKRPVTRDEAVKAFQDAGFCQYGTKEENQAELDALDAALLAECERIEDGELEPNAS